MHTASRAHADPQDSLCQIDDRPNPSDSECCRLLIAGSTKYENNVTSQAVSYWHLRTESIGIAVLSAIRNIPSNRKCTPATSIFLEPCVLGPIMHFAWQSGYYASISWYPRCHRLPSWSSWYTAKVSRAFLNGTGAILAFHIHRTSKTTPQMLMLQRVCYQDVVTCY